MYVGRDEGVAYCMVQPERPPTPPKVAAYRHISHPPGTRVLHPGMKDFKEAPDAVFGSIDKSERATSEHVLSHAKPPMTQFLEDRAEAQYYRSVKAGPLGRSALELSVKLPAKTAAPGFAFGRPSGGSGGGPVETEGLAARESLFPVAPPAEDADRERALYAKSHGSYPPGVRRDHPVVWEATGVDPLTFAFGKKSGRTPAGAIIAGGANASGTSVTKGTADAVATLLNPHTDDKVDKSRIVPKVRVCARAPPPVAQAFAPRCTPAAAPPLHTRCCTPLPPCRRWKTSG